MDLMDEIVNENKLEKRLILIRRYLPWILVFTILIALGITYLQYYSHSRLLKKQDLTAKFSNLLEAKGIDQFEKINSFVVEAKGFSLVDLALLYQIKMLAAEQKWNQLLEKVDIIVADSKLLAITKDLVRIFVINLAIEYTDKYSTDFDKSRIEGYIKNLNYSQDNVFYGNFIIAKALWFKMQGRYEEAKEELQNLIGSSVAEDIKSSARVVLEYLPI